MRRDRPALFDLIEEPFERVAGSVEMSAMIGRRGLSVWQAMLRRDVIKAIAVSVILWPVAARAQQSAQPALARASCQSVPPGPARTDCYLGLTRIHRQQSEISASVARQEKDMAKYRRVTGSHHDKRHRSMPGQ